MGQLFQKVKEARRKRKIANLESRIDFNKEVKIIACEVLGKPEAIEFIGYLNKETEILRTKLAKINEELEAQIMGSWLSNKKKELVIKRTHSRCGYCGKEMPIKDQTIDHVIPKSKGGDNSLSNLLLSCKTCNSSKGIRMLSEYRIWVQYKDICISQNFTASQMMWMIENTNISECLNRSAVSFFFEGNEDSE